MGMSIDEAIQVVKHCTFANPRRKIQITMTGDRVVELADAITILVDTARKYQMIQADYNARLKADLRAILVELQLEIEELEPLCNECDYAIDDCTSKAKVNNIIQQKINELPPVTPIRPKGHWIDKQHLCNYCSAECSSCHKRSNGYVHDNGFSLEHKYYDFCPNCGSYNGGASNGNE